MYTRRTTLLALSTSPLMVLGLTNSGPKKILVQGPQGEAYIGPDNLVGLHIKRDYEEVLDPHIQVDSEGRLTPESKAWLKTQMVPWNRQVARSEAYIPLPNGKRLPIVRVLWRLA